MPDNKDIAQQLTTLAPNSTALEVIREISFAELGEAFKDCTPLKVRVNPPAIFDEMLRSNIDEQNPPRDKVLRALPIFTAIKTEDLTKWSDPLLYWVFYRARELYWTFWGEQRNLTTR